MKKILLLLALLATMLALAACSSGFAKAPEVNGKQPGGTGGIAYHAPKYSVVEQGDGRIIIEVKNQNTTVATYTYTSSQTYDFNLKQNGKVVYTWSQDKLFMQAVSERTVKQGESERFEIDLTDCGVSKGEYEMVFWSTAKELKDVQSLKLNVTIK